MKLFFLPVAEEAWGSSEGKEKDNKVNEVDLYNGAQSPDSFTSIGDSNV